jgi:hypothetical protein
LTPSTPSLLQLDRPHLVPEHIGTVRLRVTDNWTKVRDIVGAFMTSSPAQIGLRIAGGCSNMSAQDKIDMIEYFVAAFDGFSGFMSSGGTRDVTADGQIDPMVTDVPAAIAASNHNVLTLSTVPLTGEMGLVDDSRLVLDTSNGVNPQPGVHMIVAFQNDEPTLGDGTEQYLGWDGDVDPYFQLFGRFVRLGWLFGLTSWNGGDVTYAEAQRAAESGWPTFLVEGSGRKTDELIGQVRPMLENPPSGADLSVFGVQNFVIVQRDDPTTLKSALIERSFITAP